jgi:hypothetical protein
VEIQLAKCDAVVLQLLYFPNFISPSIDEGPTEELKLQSLCLGSNIFAVLLQDGVASKNILNNYRYWQYGVAAKGWCHAVHIKI